MVAVLGPEQPTPLQDRDDLFDKRVQQGRQDRRHDVEAVRGGAGKPVLDHVGNLRRVPAVALVGRGPFRRTFTPPGVVGECIDGATLKLWASSLREAEARLCPLFTQRRAQPEPISARSSPLKAIAGPSRTASSAAKNEFGLDHNESRSWRGWHRPVSLVMLAFAMMATIRHRAHLLPASQTACRPSHAVRHASVGRSRKSAVSPRVWLNAASGRLTRSLVRLATSTSSHGTPSAPQQKCATVMLASRPTVTEQFDY